MLHRSRVLVAIAIIMCMCASAITPTAAHALSSLSSVELMPPRSNPVNTTYLDIAIKAANWIVASGINTPYGTYWPDSMIGQKSEPYNRSLDLYSGVAGTVLYLIEIYRVTPNPVYMQAAINGTNYIMHQLDSQLTAKADTSLYHGGIAGLGYILRVMADYVGDVQYSVASRRVLEYVIARGTKTATGLKLHHSSILRWGSTGIALYLLDEYQRSKDPALLQVIVSAATEILSEGVPAKEGGLKWFYEGKSGVELPNYADGAAGVGYFFASVYHFTGDQTWLQAAQQAAQYLLAIANKDNGECQIIHSNTSPDMYYLGECNGPVGTGRFWYRMYQVTKDEQWLRWAHASAKTIMVHAGNFAPFNWVYHRTHTDPVWNNYGLCDGTAGAVEYFNYLYQATKQHDYFDYAVRLTDDIIAHGTSTPGNGMMWVTDEWRTNPVGTRAPQSGYMQGAAGIGSTLLGMHSSLNNLPWSSVRIEVPDSPANFGFLPSYISTA